LQSQPFAEKYTRAEAGRTVTAALVLGAQGLKPLNRLSANYGTTKVVP
jgi:hypothetical protein